MANSQKCLSFIIRLYIIKETAGTLIEHLLRFHICRNVMKIYLLDTKPRPAPQSISRSKLVVSHGSSLPSITISAVSIQRFKSLETTASNGILFKESRKTSAWEILLQSTVRANVLEIYALCFLPSAHAGPNTMKSYSIHNYVSKYTPK